MWGQWGWLGRGGISTVTIFCLTKIFCLAKIQTATRWYLSEVFVSSLLPSSGCPIVVWFFFKNGASQHMRPIAKKVQSIHLFTLKPGKEFLEGHMGTFLACIRWMGMWQLGWETDGTAFQADLKTVRGTTAVLQHPAAQPTGAIPCTCVATAAFR